MRFLPRAPDMMRALGGEWGSDRRHRHVARKKVPCLDPDKGGGSVPLQPSEPNAIKLELFIFDTFPHAAKLVALQVSLPTSTLTTKRGSDEATCPRVQPTPRFALAARATRARACARAERARRRER